MKDNIPPVQDRDEVDLEFQRDRFPCPTAPTSPGVKQIFRIGSGPIELNFSLVDSVSLS